MKYIYIYNNQVAPQASKQTLPSTSNPPPPWSHQVGIGAWKGPRFRPRGDLNGRDLRHILQDLLEVLLLLLLMMLMMRNRRSRRLMEIVLLMLLMEMRVMIGRKLLGDGSRKNSGRRVRHEIVEDWRKLGRLLVVMMVVVWKTWRWRRGGGRMLMEQLRRRGGCAPETLSPIGQGLVAYWSGNEINAFSNPLELPGFGFNMYRRINCDDVVDGRNDDGDNDDDWWNSDQTLC